ncbi:hypothetical protein [Roseiconus lacunae]|uniref:Restriction endonuclease subunit S n=1 Tax=Roseiconus lacunae TaxID=2605694 RepID=A0ABT7PNU5_9BACT|nr:hypothetical protein [Roseiconus lacunae]MDM4018178.1 hypothetical protein [Roseiconus lacunae]
MERQLGQWLATDDIHPDRLDAVFYRPERTENDRAIRSSRFGVKSLGKLATRVFKGAFYVLSDEYKNSGVPFLRTLEIKTGFVTTDDCVFLSPETHEREKRTAVFPCDLILAKTGGSIGYSAVVPEGVSEANICQDLVGVNLTDDTDPYFVHGFIRSRFGQVQAIRWGQGNAHPHLGLDGIREWSIPDAPIEVQTAIGNRLRKAERLTQLAAFSRHSAESLLNQALQFTARHHSDTHPTWSAIESTHGRLDAEFYQPKYLDLDSFVSNLPTSVRRVDTLDTLIHDGAYGVLPSSSDYGTGCLPFLRAQDVGDFTVEFKEPMLVPRDYENPKAIAREGDMLLEVKGAIEGGAICPKQADGFLVNGSIYRARVSEDIHPHYLIAVLTSVFGRLQKQRAAANSIISYLSSDFLGALSVPRIDDRVENKVGDLLEQFCSLTYESTAVAAESESDIEKLLNNSLDVESLIEEGAMIEKWLEENQVPSELEVNL